MCGERELKLIGEVERLKRELAEANVYADKLAAGLPEGMLPKDIELLRKANCDFAQELQEARTQEKLHFDNYVFAQDQYNALAEAAREVIERWDSPLWKYAYPTAAVMNKLRNILDPVERENYD
jgi:hypothetical protein